MSDRTREWLETDGLGGFASGTVHGARTRRYHGLLLAATRPPAGRMMLVNGVEALVQAGKATFGLGTQRYAPGVDHPAETARVELFSSEPWPTWILAGPDGTRVRQELFMTRGAPITVMTWRLQAPVGGCMVPRGARVRLAIRLLFSGRDYHALHHANDAFRFAPRHHGGCLTWKPYDGVPGITVGSNGRYTHDPLWYRNFQYDEELARGLPATEDLASPGAIEFDLGSGEAVLVLAADGEASVLPGAVDPAAYVADCRTVETRRRERFASALHRAADSYLVKRGDGLTVIAGYPWFTDWGRDTFIALRGLCLATGRLDEALAILLAWAQTVSRGMVPNRFPDAGDEPEYNSVDASLWYVIAAAELLEGLRAAGQPAAPREERALRRAALAILDGYRAGTRYGIRAADDGLLAAGEPGQQLTWMDARVDAREITPRIGKPVEVQALWINALAAGASWSADWGALLDAARGAFEARFWNESRRCLYDVVDVDHRRGAVDGSIRPNQVLAVGGLPERVLGGPRARAVVDTVEAALWTPMGLRSLAPEEPGYAPRYAGSPAQRDAAYHQGTVWPWLAGPFVDAWLRVRGDDAATRAAARDRFLAPLRRHLEDAGAGHVSEIADAEPPHEPRGCPFQAWSLGELLRIEQRVAGEAPAKREMVTAP